METNVLAAAEEAVGKERINVSSTEMEKPWFIKEVKLFPIWKQRSYLKYRSLKIEK